MSIFYVSIIIILMTNSVSCIQQAAQKIIISSSMVLYVPYSTQPWKISSGGKQIIQQKIMKDFAIF